MGREGKGGDIPWWQVLMETGEELLHCAQLSCQPSTQLQRGQERICGAGRDLRSRHAIQISILQFHTFAFPSLLLCPLLSLLALLSMLGRVSQLTRHLSRQLPAYTNRSATALTGAMTSSTPDSLGKRMIHSAACLIIGDEVLGGKVSGVYVSLWCMRQERVCRKRTLTSAQTTDTNSAYMAKFCFNLGIAMKRIEVIGDDSEEIMEACRRMSKNYDFVVTSGGIGPT